MIIHLCKSCKTVWACRFGDSFQLCIDCELYDNCKAIPLVKQIHIEECYECKVERLKKLN